MKEIEKEKESDLSLIEIAREDDSLLPQIHNDDDLRQKNQERSTSHRNDSLFMCSPFLNVRSSVSNTDSSIALPSASHIDENVSSANKSETSNFSIEPQQMKRKRKGVGYNLRKSLAWNRAFFTEEGVLNPLELSMITSDLSSSRGKKLLGIQEEESGSSHGDLNRLSDSAGFHSHEESLYKELPTTTPNKDRKIGCDLLPKNASSTKDNVSPDLQLVSFQVKHKVLSVQDINRSGSKRSGCPRPVAPSSVKRPATTNTTKAANTEANFSRIPSYKSDPSLIHRTVKHANVSESDPKINQASQRATVQKNKTTKSPAINTKSVLNKAKAGISSRSLTPKTSIHDARRNVTGQLQKKNSTILHRQSSTKASLGTGVMPKSSVCHPSSDQDGGSSKIVVSLPLNTSCTDGNMLESHIQTAKPSGLRRPSPSLQFFSQGKVVAMQSPLHRKNDQSKKCDASNFSNANTVDFLNTIVEPRLPPVPKMLSKLVNDEATRRNIIPCPSTVHLKGVSVTNSDVCVAKNDASVHEFKSCQFISRPSPALQIEDVSEDVTLNSLVDNTLNVAKDLKYIPIGDSISSSLESRQVVEVCYSHTNSEIKHERPKNFQNSYMELDMTMENQIENAVAALDFQIPNVCSKTGESNHGDYSLNTAQLGAELMQEDKESEECPSQASKATSNLHPADYTCSSQLDTSLKQTVKSCRTIYDNNEKGVTVEKFITENQHPEANHHLVEKLNFPDELQRLNSDAAEVNSMATRLCRSGLKNHDHRSKDKHGYESNCEVYEVNDFIEKSCERVIRGPEDVYAMVLNDSNAQQGDLENQNPQFEDGKIIVGNDHELCLKDKFLAMTTKSTPTVCGDEKVLVSFIEPCGVYESENPNDFTQATSALPNSALDERKIVEQTSVKEVIIGSLASATVEKFDCFGKIVSTLYDLPSEQTTLESESSVTVSNNISSKTTIVRNPSKSCLLSNEPDSRLSEQTMLREHIGPNEQKNPIALDENITTPSEIDATSDREMFHESTTVACSVPDEDTNVHVRKSMECDKQDSLVIKPPPSAAPFSEEWLAAFEAAGEEILTKKSGAVQNSPPDKPQPEPGPWSPVRRKYNQAIGPYDCTKYTNIPLPPDSS